jgi:hypothetical protein
MNAQSAAALRSDLVALSQMLAAFSAHLGTAAATMAQPALPAPVELPDALPVPARQPRRCGYCRRPGHRRTHCPQHAADLGRVPVPVPVPAAGRLLQLDIGGHRFIPSVQAECPVCLETKECCRLACDHPLCGRCVKLQWDNNLRSCGLCRAPLAPK